MILCLPKSGPINCNRRDHNTKYEFDPAKSLLGAALAYFF